VLVIDPGPALTGHLAAILAALAPGERITAIVVSHAHLDHSALAPALAARCGAAVAAFGGASAGRSAAMTRLLQGGLQGGGEGVDHGFAPDLLLPDGAELCGFRLGGAAQQIEALHTPGHMGNHLCLGWNGLLFSGDQAMGWSTSLISPPDGDMADYMASLARLAARDWRLMLPGHGEVVADPAARLAELAAHRRMREAAVLNALADGPATPGEVARRLYHDTPPGLLPAAERNVLAHLVDLTERSLTAAHPFPGPKARFQLLPQA
jgi:glyoxylase-like metal-dependent hydrolase (beta-lactamase superfamily II)